MRTIRAGKSEKKRIAARNIGVMTYRNAFCSTRMTAIRIPLKTRSEYADLHREFVNFRGGSCKFSASFYTRCWVGVCWNRISFVTSVCDFSRQ